VTEPIVLSIVVATYNRLAELKSMLESLLPQVQDSPTEVLIVDDASTDGTWEWVTERYTGDERILPLRLERNSGPGPARNAGLSRARGRYFLPIDSDFLVAEGAIGAILKTLEVEVSYRLFFFPCLIYPSMRRSGGLTGRREVTYDLMISGVSGELIPVADLAYIRANNLKYPELRAGGESLLWASILRSAPGLFVDSPVVLYRTDVTERICTLEYQMKNPAALAEVSDAILSMLRSDSSPSLRGIRAQKYLASGSYYLLAGNMWTGRRRLLSAAAEGCWIALPTVVLSFAGQRIFRILFGAYRTRFARAYL
jgi:glycosyltransferase involved in cell wall biosynthesis